MKTSLTIDDRVFRAAKKEAARHGRTIGELISEWARLGLEYLLRVERSRKRQLKCVHLGGPAAIDLSSRRDWMETLSR
ncbi:MAG: hypothetical protein HYV03_09060 [Deltaproteobacteria bacterium]|nr:hypothetical protein [Deltaproteobacteria bacterium]